MSTLLILRCGNQPAPYEARERRPSSPSGRHPYRLAELQGDTLAWARKPLEQLAGERGYTVVERALAQGHGGTCFPQRRLIEINDAQSVNARISVLCHELAHALVRHDRQDSDPPLNYAAEELVAESIAHLAISSVGLDASVAAVPYLAAWAEDAPANAFPVSPSSSSGSRGGRPTFCVGGSVG